MRNSPRRKILQLSAAAFPALTGCVFSEQSTEAPTVAVEIAVENTTDAYYQADLVVLDEYESKVFDRDGVGWDDGSAVTYQTEVPQDRAADLVVKVFLPQQGTTQLFEKVVEPSYASGTATIDVTVTPGPDVAIRT